MTHNIEIVMDVFIIIRKYIFSYFKCDLHKNSFPFMPHLEQDKSMQVEAVI